jgi:hypothetical protein
VASVPVKKYILRRLGRGQFFFAGRGAKVPAQEVEVVCSNSLAQLRDKLICIYDDPAVYHLWNRHIMIRTLDWLRFTYVFENRSA